MMSISSSRLIVVLTGLVAALALAGAGLVALADALADFGAAIAGADAGLVLAIHEAVLADAADRHLDHAVAAAADDGLFGHDVADVVADRLAHLLAVPGAIAGAAVRAQRVGRE